MKPRLLEGVLDSFARVSDGAIWCWSKARAARRKSISAPATSPIWAFAEASGTPVILTGDIDRGGVIAQIVGTQAVMSDADNALVKGFLINKFRGDVSLFEDGYRLIEQRTGWAGFGIVPWFADAGKLPAEDASDMGALSRASTRDLDEQRTDPRGPGSSPGAGICVVCLQLSRIANFDDLDPLRAEPGVSVEMLAPGKPIPGDAALVIIPGSKSTRGDLAFLREQGWDIDLIAHHRRGGSILGLCGGYQMLGKTIADPEGIEGPPGVSEGLGLLDVETVMIPEKALTKVTARDLVSGSVVSGYEIHIGRTDGPDRARALFQIGAEYEGATSPDGRVQGTYLHGVFSENAFRRAFLARLGAESGRVDYGGEVDASLDALAAHLETNLDLDGLYEIALAAN